MKMKHLFMITCGIVTTEVVWQMYKVYRRYKKKTKTNISNNCVARLHGNVEATTKICEVIFFSQDSALCRFHLPFKKPCKKANCAVGNLIKIINYLNSAIDTVDICIYFFTCKDLAEAIVNARKRGVLIRMVLDESMTNSEESQTIYFYEEDIKLKVKKLDVLIHHKFAIIDKSILINGSVNWTKAAFFGNFENLIVTNESTIVKPFVNEFERIWTMLDED